jgi:hypothetical protein
MISVGFAETVSELSICKDVAESLHKKYPGHLWAVSVQGGMIVIKNLAISHTHGMCVKLENYYADPRNKRILLMAGELLERAHLKRGRDEGAPVNILEGVAAKYQPSNGRIR